MLKCAINIHTATIVIFNDDYLIILMSNVNQKFIIPMRIKKNTVRNLVLGDQIIISISWIVIAAVRELIIFIKVF